MSKCIHKDCANRVSGSHIACLWCWKSFPDEIKAGIQERIKGWKNMNAAREFAANFLKTRKKDA